LAALAAFFMPPDMMGNVIAKADHHEIEVHHPFAIDQGQALVGRGCFSFDRVLDHRRVREVMAEIFLGMMRTIENG
jgi:hypothetical protein